MAQAVVQGYQAASGEEIYAGQSRVVSPAFDSVSIVSEDYAVPDAANIGNVLVVELHGSGGTNYITGRQYVADVSGPMAYDSYNQFRFSTVKSVEPGIFLLRANDNYGNYPSTAMRESMWLGFKHIPDSYVRLITQRRLEAMIAWADDNLTYEAPNKRCLRGGSMGGWGTLSFGIRRPHVFAALYPDRPRWRHNATIGNIAVADWTNLLDSVPVANAPSLAPEDGGGSVADYMDITTYVADTNKKIPWIGFCVGRQDGFVNFSDYVDAVNALRTAKRGFAFAWNDGNHSTGSIMAEITQSYYYGLFEIGKGYPLFTEHSGDQDPAIDLVGGINIGLTFRNVVESAGSWACEVTSVLGGRTVKVEPISDVFQAAVAPQLVTIPSANTWVPVSFST